MAVPEVGHRGFAETLDSQALELLEGQVAFPGLRAGFGELTEQESVQSFQHSGQVQMGEHPVDAVQLFPHVLEEEQGPPAVREIGCAQKAGDEGTATAHQGACGGSRVQAPHGDSWNRGQVSAAGAGGEHRPEVLLGEGVGVAPELDSRHRTRERDQPGSAEERELEEGDVAVADEDFRVATDGGDVEVGKKFAAAMATAEGENGPDPGVTEHRVQVVGPLGHGAGGKPVSRLEVTSGLDAVPEALQVADTGWDLVGMARGACRGDQTDDVAAAEAWRAERLHLWRLCGRRLRGESKRSVTERGRETRTVASPALKSDRTALSLAPMLYDRDYMRDEDRAPWRSPVVVLLAVLGVLFLAECFLRVFANNSSLGTYFALGYQPVMQGEVWRLVTFQFLHTAPWPFHFLFNALGLWFFGRPVLESQGTARFWQIYLSAGLVGGLFELACQAWHPAYPSPWTVGASANVLGLVGAFCLLNPSQELTVFFYVLPVHLRSMTMFWVFFGFSLFGAIFPSGGIAHAAHLGGLLAGAAFVKWFIEGSARDWFRNLIPARPIRRAKAPPVVVSQHAGSPPRPATSPAAIPTGAAPVPEDSEDFIRREVDPILDKISAHGIHSLTERERRTLERARERMQRPSR